MVAPQRILVVDDEPVVNDSCRRVLIREGFEVETTDRGREGLREALSEPFDLVITDLKMPDLDGMELVRTVRGQRPRLAVVVITGYGTVPSAVEATRLGVSDYLEKPFSPEELREAVHRALPRRRKPPGDQICADLVKEVLRLAAGNPAFERRLWDEGSRALTGLSLSSEAKAAILSGDIAWVERRCGKLSEEEREWLERRLQAEVW